MNEKYKKILVGNLKFKYWGKLALLSGIGFNLWLSTLSSRVLSYVENIVMALKTITFGMSDTINNSILAFNIYGIITFILSIVLWYQIYKALIWVDAYHKYQESSLNTYGSTLTYLLCFNLISLTLLKIYVI